ncbi:MAG: NAD-dependent protein deacetylase [Steroidobacteraceae bacterium]
MSREPLHDFLARHPRLFVLTGAGCSTASGIPDYRDANGQWKHAPPTHFSSFMGNQAMRRRYWARSLIGWPRVQTARPNGAHAALSNLERQGRIELLVTQNVDGLHQAAGTRQILDLHGRIDQVVCMSCAQRSARAALQERLLRMNPLWDRRSAQIKPDGDADLEGLSFEEFHVPPCERCGGILKPDVVFFGETVPRPRVDQAFNALARADALLVVGSSLMIYSGYRFVQAASAAGMPIAAVNLGRTRADPLLTLKVSQPCAEALAGL